MVVVRGFLLPLHLRQLRLQRFHPRAHLLDLLLGRLALGARPPALGERLHDDDRLLDLGLRRSELLRGARAGVRRGRELAELTGQP